MTKRVLYVTECKMNGNGIDLVIDKQVRALTCAGHPVELLSRGRLSGDNITNRTWRIPPSKTLSWMPSKDYYAANSRCFSWLGTHYIDPRKHKAVIAWTHTAHAVFRKAKQAGIPRILNAAGPHRLYNTVALRDLRWPKLPLSTTLEEYELADRILVASDFAAETFVAHGIPKAKLRTVYRGVDLQNYYPDYDKPRRPFIVASCGLLGDRKGTYQLLNAWATLGLPDAELWLIGHIPTNEEQELRALAPPSVRFFGFRRDLPDLLRKAHLHVLLSRSEGFAKVLLEASASGVPNLCTSASGMPHGTPGTRFIDSRDNVSAICTQLYEAYCDTEGTGQLGKEACAFVAEKFTWSAFGDRVVSALEDVLMEYEN